MSDEPLSQMDTDLADDIGNRPLLVWGLTVR